MYNPEYISLSGVHKRFHNLIDSTPTTPLLKRPRLAKTLDRSINSR
jgi:hypothetical protein